MARELAAYPRLAIICGRYEGVDERVRQLVVTDEISIGDYVLTGGELPAMVMIDAIARNIPGVLGSRWAADDDFLTQPACWNMPITPARRAFAGWTFPRRC